MVCTTSVPVCLCVAAATSCASGVRAMRSAGGRDFYTPLSEKADRAGAPLYGAMLRWRHHNNPHQNARQPRKSGPEAVPKARASTSKHRHAGGGCSRDSSESSAGDEAAAHPGAHAERVSDGDVAEQTSSRRRAAMDDVSLMKALRTSTPDAYIPGTCLGVSRVSNRTVPLLTVCARARVCVCVCVFSACTADFTMQGELGRGAHGVVYKATSKRDGREYVIKQVSVRRMKDKQRRNAVAEVLILRRLNHPNIVRYYNCFVTNQTLYIVMEFATKGDLYSIIESRRRSKKFYGERTLWRYFWQLCQVREPLNARNTSRCCREVLLTWCGGCWCRV